jgi:hypothetical protein
MIYYNYTTRRMPCIRLKYSNEFKEKLSYWLSYQKVQSWRRTDKTKMATKFYSYWVFVTQDTEINNASTQDLANQLQTVLGTHKLLSLTSSATNGVVVTTIAYEVPEE